MKNYLLIGCLFLSVVVHAQTKGDLLERFDQQRSSEHFVLQWNRGETTDAEIEEALVFAEAVYTRLTALLGQDRMPAEKLILTFGGEGVNRKTGKKRTPHVDSQGRSHLYRFDMGGYLSPLPHELVHAIRLGNMPRWERFFEEGVASAIAYYLYPERKGFPRFGYPLDVVAGYWLSSGKGIPLETMMWQHNRLNLKCQLQTYVMREDFFNYLVVTYGVERLISYAYSDDVGRTEPYAKYWGKEFKALVADWEADLRKRYAAYDGAEILVGEYFENTSAKYIPVCEAGVDY